MTQHVPEPTGRRRPGNTTQREEVTFQSRAVDIDRSCVLSGSLARMLMCCSACSLVVLGLGPLSRWDCGAALSCVLGKPAVPIPCGRLIGRRDRRWRTDEPVRAWASDLTRRSEWRPGCACQPG